MNLVNTGLPAARNSTVNAFRVSVVAASVIAAVVGSVLLVLHESGESTTTTGVVATLPVPGHPGPVVASSDTLWLALEEAEIPVRDRPLLHLDLATGTFTQTVNLGGQASHLARVGDRLFASVEHVGGDGTGPSLLVALDWHSGGVLTRRQFAGLVGPVAEAGNDLWALQVRPAALLHLDGRTLLPMADSLPLGTERSLGLAVGAGYVWATAADTGEVLRIDPVTRAIARRSVGGSPVGIVVAGESVWVADRARGSVVRLEPKTLRQVGEPIHAGVEPSWLGAAGRYLFVSDAGLGTVARIELRSGKPVGPPIRFAQPAKDVPEFAPATSGSSVWVSSFASRSLTRISATGSAAHAPPVTPSSAKEAVGGAPARTAMTGAVKVRIDFANDGRQVSEGIAGTGRFTAAGAIADRGKTVIYRTETKQEIILRYINVGEKGTITFVVTIDLSNATSRWTIASGTKAYQGLHGQGNERENATYTRSTLTGRVWR